MQIRENTKSQAHMELKGITINNGQWSDMTRWFHHQFSDLGTWWFFNKSHFAQYINQLIHHTICNSPVHHARASNSVHTWWPSVSSSLYNPEPCDLEQSN